MKRIVQLAALGSRLAVSAVFLSPSADAATVCGNYKNSPGMGWREVCKIDRAPLAGSHMTGVVTWHYPDAQNQQSTGGTAALEVEDTQPDGSCAWGRLRYKGPSATETQWFSACGNGETAKTSWTLNRQVSPIAPARTTSTSAPLRPEAPMCGVRA